MQSVTDSTHTFSLADFESIAQNETSATSWIENFKMPLCFVSSISFFGFGNVNLLVLNKRQCETNLKPGKKKNSENPFKSLIIFATKNAWFDWGKKERNIF